MLIRRWLVVLVVTALAQPVVAMSKEEAHGEQVKVALAKLQTGPAAPLLTVTLRNKHRVEGYLEHVSDHSFFVADPNTGVSTQVAYANVAQVNAARSMGAKIAITGAVVGAAVFVVVMMIACGAVVCLGQ